MINIGKIKTIKIDVPFNNYQIPTDVREEVVQKIVDYFVDHISYIEETYNTHWISYSLEWEPDKDDCVVLLKKKPLMYGCRWKDKNEEEYIRVRGVEIDAAFKAMADAGYYLFSTFIANRGSYQWWWWNKPSLCGMSPIENPKFNVFID